MALVPLSTAQAAQSDVDPQPDPGCLEQSQMWLSPSLGPALCTAAAESRNLLGGESGEGQEPGPQGLPQRLLGGGQ